MSDRPPRCFRLGDGKFYQLGRIKLRFKACAADTGGAYTVCEAVEPPQSGADLHRHLSYDETHIICEGAQLIPNQSPIALISNRSSTNGVAIVIRNIWSPIPSRARRATFPP